MLCPVCLGKQILIKEKIKSYQYYQCQKCDCLFLDPMPSVELLKNYYQRFSYSVGFINEIKVREIARQIIKRVLKLKPQSRTLLDIGCGAGFFLEEAMEQGIQVSGIEPSKKLAKLARNRLKIPVYNSELTTEIVRKMSLKFDVILISHLIEHISNPHLFMRLVNQLLNKNGLLVIETQNINSFQYLLEKENYTFYIPPEHLCFYSLKTFRYLLSKYYYKYSRIEYYSSKEHFVGLIKAIFKLNNKKNGLTKKSLNKPNLLYRRVSFIQNIKILIFNKILATICLPFFDFLKAGSYIRLYLEKH